MPATIGPYDVLRRIRPLHDLAAKAVTQSLADHDLTMPMRAVLERVYDVGPQTVPDIARWLSVTRQGVQTLVDETKRLGYLTAQANPTHKRSHLIALTDNGRIAFETLHRQELTSLEQLAADLDPQDVATCVRVLDHLVAGLTKLTNSPGHHGKEPTHA